MGDREYWTKNASWQYGEMVQLPDDVKGGKYRTKSAHFDEYVYALKVLNELGGNHKIPTTPRWYIPEGKPRKQYIERAKFWAYKNYLAIAFGFKQVVENFHWWQLCLSHETRPEFLMDRFWDRLNTHSAVASVNWD